MQKGIYNLKMEEEEEEEGLRKTAYPGYQALYHFGTIPPSNKARNPLPWYVASAALLPPKMIF